MSNKDAKSRVKKPPTANLRPHVYTWGWGADGRLGVGNEYDQLTPQQIKVNNDLTTKVVQVASGGRHTLVLTKSGEMYTWGCGENGQLGLGDKRRCQLTPTPIPSLYKKGSIVTELDKIVYIAAGGYASYALTEGGKVVSWGTEWQSNDAHIVRLKPTFLLLADRNVRQISAGDKHVVALTNTGAVFAWGFGKNGRLGHGDNKDRKEPAMVNGLRGARVVQVSAGGAHTAVVADVRDQVWFPKIKPPPAYEKMTRAVITWGANLHGQCGIGENINDQWKPRIVEELLTRKQKPEKVSCGCSHTLCLNDYGQIWAWGDGTYGQTGTGTNYIEWIPIMIDKGFDDGSLRIIDIAAGARHSMAITVNKDLYAWGYGFYGEHGQGDTKVKLWPHLVKQMQFVRCNSVSGSARHTTLLLETDRVEGEEEMDEEMRREVIKETAKLDVRFCENVSPSGGLSYCPLKIMFHCGPCNVNICEVCGFSCHQGHHIDIKLLPRDYVCDCPASNACTSCAVPVKEADTNEGETKPDDETKTPEVEVDEEGNPIPKKKVNLLQGYRLNLYARFVKEPQRGVRG